MSSVFNTMSKESIALIERTDTLNSDCTYNYPILVKKRIQQAKETNRLDLSCYALGTLPEELFNLDRLEVLVLDFNELTELPSEIKYLKSLKKLIAPWNHIEELPYEIGYLSELEVINLTYNQVSQYPKVLFCLEKLRYVSLKRNPIEFDPLALTHVNYELEF